MTLGIGHNLRIVTIISILLFSTVSISSATASPDTDGDGIVDSKDDCPNGQSNWSSNIWSGSISIDSILSEGDQITISAPSLNYLGSGGWTHLGSTVTFYAVHGDSNYSRHEFSIDGTTADVVSDLMGAIESDHAFPSYEYGSITQDVNLQTSVSGDTLTLSMSLTTDANGQPYQDDTGTNLAQRIGVLWYWLLIHSDSQSVVISPFTNFDWDRDGCNDEEDSDDDNDGYPDSSDQCPKSNWMFRQGNTQNETASDSWARQTWLYPWNHNSLSDHDGDGCITHVINISNDQTPFHSNLSFFSGSPEDLDSDNDGISDLQEMGMSSYGEPFHQIGGLAKKCALGEVGWISTLENDNDQDGCKDLTEDLDDDGDGFSDEDELLNCGEEFDPLDATSFPPNHDDDGYHKYFEMEDVFPEIYLNWRFGGSMYVAYNYCDYMDPDDDNDDVLDNLDHCPQGIASGNRWDSFAHTEDYDGDGCHDLEDEDDDNDGWSDIDETVNCGENNDPLDSINLPTDTDGDMICNNLDNDDDNDGTLDVLDSFPLDASETVDYDGDGVGDNADTDDDDDGWIDNDEEACSTDSLDDESTPADTDSDGDCNYLDDDDDDDGHNDVYDAFPLDSTEWDDSDGDGIGSNTDTDDDGDGWLDAYEVECLTDPYYAISTPRDTDGDLICDIVDLDDDEDGWSDNDEEACTTDPLDDESTPADTDSDGDCNYLDVDDDNDGIYDHVDAYPFDSNRFLPEEKDGLAGSIMMTLAISILVILVLIIFVVKRR